MVGMSRAELLELPVVIDLVTAARALGIGRTRAFELVRRGEFPVPVLRVGATWRVPAAPLLGHSHHVRQPMTAADRAQRRLRTRSLDAETARWVGAQASTCAP